MEYDITYIHSFHLISLITLRPVSKNILDVEHYTVRIHFHSEAIKF